MTVSANIWQARAAMCELLALSFRYPEDKVLAEAIASGEWGEAADEIAGALGYAKQNYFTRLFTKYFGESPRAYRNKYGSLTLPAPEEE